MKATLQFAAQSMKAKATKTEALTVAPKSKKGPHEIIFFAQEGRTCRPTLEDIIVALPWAKPRKSLFTSGSKL